MKIIIYLLAFLIISSTYVFADPVVDPASIKNQDKYYRDNAECKALAKDNKGGAGNVAKNTVIGAGVGAGTGALLGVIGGSVGKGLGIGAVVGGVAGGGASIYKNHKNYDEIYKNCMRGRGYRVLN
jgi:outer membrane lipoprotein SlyB